MAKIYSDTLHVDGKANLSAIYGPWNSIQAAKDYITGESGLWTSLTKGMTIGVIENGKIVEYWINDDTKNFVKKAVASYNDLEDKPSFDNVMFFDPTSEVAPDAKMTYADSALKATEDSKGNVIHTTYGTKAETSKAVADAASAKAASQQAAGYTQEVKNLLAGQQGTQVSGELVDKVAENSTNIATLGRDVSQLAIDISYVKDVAEKYNQNYYLIPKGFTAGEKVVISIKFSQTITTYLQIRPAASSSGTEYDQIDRKTYDGGVVYNIDYTPTKDNLKYIRIENPNAYDVDIKIISGCAIPIITEELKKQTDEINEINNVSIPKLSSDIANIGASVGDYKSDGNALIPISTGVGYPRLDKQQIYYDENYSYGIFDVSQYSVIVHTFYGMTNLSVFGIALSNDAEMTNDVKYIAYTKEQGDQNIDVAGYKYLAVLVSYKGTNRTSVFGTIFFFSLKKEIEDIKKDELSSDYIQAESNRIFVGGYPRLDKSFLYGSGYRVGVYQLGLGIRYRLEFSAINTQYFCIGFSNSDNAITFDYVKAYPSTNGVIDIESEEYKYAYVLLSNEVNTIIHNIVYKYISKSDAALRDAKKLNGKTIWTLGDSLCHNTWQEYFKTISGCDWDAELNTKSDAPISFGGTNSLPNEDDGAQGRALNLSKYIGAKSIDYIFVENVNDIAYLSSTYLGTIDNKSFMRKQNITINPTIDITNNAEAQEYFRNNFSSIVGSIDSTKRVRGTMISIPISGTSVNGSKITFGGSVTTEGDITIVYGGVNYAVHATVGMSVQNVIDEFIKYSFGQGIKDIDNGDGSMSIFSTSSPSLRVTNVNVGNTGISANISDYAGTTPQRVFFTGDTASEFTDFSNWSFICTLYSAYKGLIEYMQTTFPTAKIYWFLPYSMNVNFSSNEYKNGDGSWSQDKFKLSNHYQWMSQLREVQMAVCEYYNLPFLDLFKESGMSINNIQTFFNSNNVHPKAIGYNRYAETILRMI